MGEEEGNSLIHKKVNLFKCLLPKWIMNTKADIGKATLKLWSKNLHFQLGCYLHTKKTWVSNACFTSLSGRSRTQQVEKQWPWPQSLWSNQLLPHTDFILIPCSILPPSRALDGSICTSVQVCLLASLAFAAVMPDVKLPSSFVFWATVNWVRVCVISSHPCFSLIWIQIHPSGFW